jgi:hypothetical protein
MAVAMGAALLFSGTTPAADKPPATQSPKQTQAREQEQTRKQAIESVRQRMKENPRDEGLRRAEGCLEHSAQCQNMHGLDQAMESVRHNMEKHPDDKGLRHTMVHLERHYQQLEKQHMERERSMHRDGGSDRPERPDRHGAPERMHR